MMNVYLLRFLTGYGESLLKSPGVVRHCRPVRETQRARGGLRMPGTMSLVRVVMTEPPPADTNLSTWRLIGNTYIDPVRKHGQTAGTYVPLERCKRDHPPLRNLSNGGCVHCAREARPGPLDPIRIRLQLPTTQAGLFDETVKVLGWVPLAAPRKHVRDRFCAAVDVPSGGWEAAAATIRAMGWEIALW